MLSPNGYLDVRISGTAHVGHTVDYLIIDSLSNVSYRSMDERTWRDVDTDSPSSEH